jgi:hypothetical protein
MRLLLAGQAKRQSQKEMCPGASAGELLMISHANGFAQDFDSNFSSREWGNAVPSPFPPHSFLFLRIFVGFLIISPRSFQNPDIRSPETAGFTRGQQKARRHLKKSVALDEWYRRKKTK